MGQTAEELRSDIERRRENMSGTVDAIEDRVLPGRIIDRRKRAARSWLGNTKERVMGTGEGVRERVSDATDTVTSSAQHMAEGVTEAPSQLMDQARGAPLVAGAVAVGVGAMLALVLPESESERRIAQTLEPQISAVADAAKSASQQTLEAAKGSAQEAAGELKDDATEHAQDVAEQAKGAAHEVGDSAQTNMSDVRDS
jgi:gas vesicle protein